MAAKKKIKPNPKLKKLLTEPSVIEQAQDACTADCENKASQSVYNDQSVYNETEYLRKRIYQLQERCDRYNSVQQEQLRDLIHRGRIWLDQLDAIHESVALRPSLERSVTIPAPPTYSRVNSNFDPKF